MRPPYRLTLATVLVAALASACAGRKSDAELVASGGQPPDGFVALTDIPGLGIRAERDCETFDEYPILVEPLEVDAQSPSLIVVTYDFPYPTAGKAGAIATLYIGACQDPEVRTLIHLVGWVLEDPPYGENSAGRTSVMEIDTSGLGLVSGDVVTVRSSASGFRKSSQIP